MLIFRILCAAAFIAVAWTEIPYDRIDLKIINNEEKLRQTMKEISVIYEEEAIVTTTRFAFSLSGVFPLLGISASLIPILIDAVRSGGREEALAKAITDGAKKEIVNQEIRKLEAKIVTIDENINLLKSRSNLQWYEQQWMVLIIHNALKEIINDFAHPKSIFREYATLALQPLFAFTSFIAVYDRIEKALYPALGSLPISCKFLDILLEYRSVVVRYRLTRLDIFERRFKQFFESTRRDLKNEMLEVLDRSFNQYGYNKTNASTIWCEFVGCGWSQSRLHFIFGGEHLTTLSYVRWGQSCLIDRSSGLFYHAGETRNSHYCILGYMELLRHRIEKAFKEPLDLIELACPEERRKLRNPTGYGYLEVTIEEVTTKLIRCDPLPFVWNLCDPYVKIILDGKEVHRTKTITNTNVAFFMDTYNSQKINKSTKIVFEVWDEDGGIAGDDDHLFGLITDIPKLLGNTKKTFYDSNYISWKSFWRDDYE